MPRSWLWSARGSSRPRSTRDRPELGQYRFLQALVREVAYSTLSRKDRRTKHLAVAAHLENEDGADAVAGIVAQHLLDALEASTPDDPEQAVMLDRARTLLASSAARAAALGSPSEAVRGYLAALELQPEPLEEADLLSRGGEAALKAGQLRQAEELCERAVGRFIDLGRPSDAASSLATLSRSVMGQGRIAESGTLANRGLALLDAAGLDAPATRILLLLNQARIVRVTAAAPEPGPITTSSRIRSLCARGGVRRPRSSSSGP